MIFCNCGQCGLRFRKGHYKRLRCLRCGSQDIWEEEIPDDEVTLVDRVVDQMLREQFKHK